MLAHLYAYVQRLSAFEQRMSNLRDMLRDLVENNDDLDEMVPLTSLLITYSSFSDWQKCGIGVTPLDDLLAHDGST